MLQLRQTERERSEGRADIRLGTALNGMEDTGARLDEG